jgi:hypothetical protein
MRNTTRKLTIVVLVLMTSCYVNQPFFVGGQDNPLVRR